MAVEGLDQAVMAALESGHDVLEGQLDLVVAERQEAPHDGGRSRLLLVEALLPGDEEAGDDAGRVCGEADRTAMDRKSR